MKLPLKLPTILNSLKNTVASRMPAAVAAGRRRAGLPVLALVLTVALSAAILPAEAGRKAQTAETADAAAALQLLAQGYDTVSAAEVSASFEVDSLDLSSLSRGQDLSALEPDLSGLDPVDPDSNPSLTDASAVEAAPAAVPDAAANAASPAAAQPTSQPTPKPTAAKPAVSSATVSRQQAIANLARSFLGVRYVHGGMSPSGFDCSGLTAYVYQRVAGISLPHSALSQSHLGQAVSRANIRVGDIICFDWDSPHGQTDHVGIYIGGGQYVHAAHSRGRVVLSTLKGSDPVLTIRRFIS